MAVLACCHECLPAQYSVVTWGGFVDRFLKNLSGHNSVINSVTINEDGVLVSGGDDGTINFWDYETGYCFQRTQTIAQPGE